MARKRKISFDISLLDDDHIMGFAAAAAAEAVGTGSGGGEAAVCEEAVMAAVKAGGSAMDHLNALQYGEEGGNSVTAEDLDSLATLDDMNKQLLLDALKVSDKRMRAGSWGNMSDITSTHMGDVVNEASTLLAASALSVTGIIDDVTNAAASLDLPSPLPSPEMPSSPISFCNPSSSSTAASRKPSQEQQQPSVPPLSLPPPSVPVNPSQSTQSTQPPSTAPKQPAIKPMNTHSMDDINAMVAAAVAHFANPALISSSSSSSPPKISTPIQLPVSDEAVKAALDAQDALQHLQVNAPPPKPKPKPKSTPRPRKSPKKSSGVPIIPTQNPSYSTPIKHQHPPSSKSTPVPSTPSSTNSSKGQSNQKWEEMFASLCSYIQERRNNWDGNVPTHYKTKDGKALGRWIGNQRSAKHKGLLRPDREQRLLDTGLKWTVLSTNAWKDMMQELRLYVQEKTKNNQKWNGNVPTNYKIKSNMAADGWEIDEHKNLGRWINRQRSLYQSGKLKKERQLELEKIGLKWSVLSTSTWDTMFESLCDYVQAKKQADPHHDWDGNVPANYKTNDTPPKNLGRWVNRQRSAYAQSKLSRECIYKLETLGLKWAVHEKKMSSPQFKSMNTITSTIPISTTSTMVTISTDALGSFTENDFIDEDDEEDVDDAIHDTILCDPSVDCSSIKKEVETPDWQPSSSSLVLDTECVSDLNALDPSSLRRSTRVKKSNPIT